MKSKPDADKKPKETPGHPGFTCDLFGHEYRYAKGYKVCRYCGKVVYTSHE